MANNKDLPKTPNPNPDYVPPSLKVTVTACPEHCAEFPLLTGEDVVAVVKSCANDRLKLKLVLRQSAIHRMLDECCGVFGWCCRRYACGGTLYTALGIFSNTRMDYTYKDAAADKDFSRFKDKAKNDEASSFVRAAAMWGIGAEIAELPCITLTDKDVLIHAVQDAKKVITHYIPGESIRVDKLAYYPDTRKIQMVQFNIGTDGKKVLWQRE